MADQDMFLNRMYSVMVSGEQPKVYTFACFDLPFAFIYCWLSYCDDGDCMEYKLLICMYVLCRGELIDNMSSNFQFDIMKCNLAKYVNEKKNLQIKSNV